MPPPQQYYSAPERPRFSFWRFCLYAIPIVVALVSTSLLAYFLLSERTQLLAQLQQDPAPQAPQQPQPAERMAQQEAPPQEAQPQRQPEPPSQRLPMPPDDVLLMLIRSSLIALNQANTTGNYTVLRELSAPGFQDANSAARLAEVFADLRSQQFDLSPILLIEPKLFSKPEMSTNGKLRVTGFFPSEPERVNFDFIFQPVRGQWRLFGIRVKTIPAPQEAPQPAPAQTSTPEPAPAPKVEAPVKPAPQAAKPPAPARKAAEKPKPAETDGAATPDVRDRIDAPPAPPPAAKPKEKSIWNPFGR